MPPLVPDTVAWLRFYTRLPIPPLAGEGEPPAAPDPSRTAYAAPVAGALIGAIGGLVLIAAWGLRLPTFLAAALALAALVIVSGGMAERALATAADKLGAAQPGERPLPVAAAGLVSYGAIALVLAILLRVGAMEGLVALGTFKAALALVAAAAVARAAGLSLTLIHPALRSEGAAAATERADTAALQRLALVALVVGAAATLPAYGVGSTIVGLAAAVGAAALFNAFAPRISGNGGREIAGAAEQAAEIAFLVAVLAFARGP